MNRLSGQERKRYIANLVRRYQYGEWGVKKELLELAQLDTAGLISDEQDKIESIFLDKLFELNLRRGRIAERFQWLASHSVAKARGFFEDAPNVLRQLGKSDQDICYEEEDFFPTDPGDPLYLFIEPDEPSEDEEEEDEEYADLYEGRVDPLHLFDDPKEFEESEEDDSEELDEADDPEELNTED